MSRISRYQESVLRFIKTKSNYSNLIKSDKKIEEIIELNDHESSVILLTVLSGQYKKKNIRAQHGYYMASGIDIIMNYVMINDNITYYEEKYGTDTVNKLTKQIPLYVYNCLMQNVDASDNIVEKDKIMKLHKSVNSYLHKRMLEVTHTHNFKSKNKVHKTDIINYKYKDKNIINNKYKKMYEIDKDVLIDYIDNTYGSVCKCAFALGWLIGLGDDKSLNDVEKLGTYLGMILKISNDFMNIERDIKYSKDNMTTNMVVNYGIHHCFSLFNENKTKLLEGCLALDIYNITIKEVIDFIEKKFDEQLYNTDLDLQSRYSSFS